jgi:hypothetical protein
LIDGSPQIVLLPFDRDKDFVDVPWLTEATVSFLDCAGIVRPEFPTSCSYGFIGDGDATFGEEFFHHTKAGAEPMGEPDGVTDDFRGEPMALVAECWLFHATQFAERQLI